MKKQSQISFHLRPVFPVRCAQVSPEASGDHPELDDPRVQQPVDRAPAPHRGLRHLCQDQVLHPVALHGIHHVRSFSSSIG